MGAPDGRHLHELSVGIQPQDRRTTAGTALMRVDVSGTRILPTMLASRGLPANAAGVGLNRSLPAAYRGSTLL